MAVGDSINSLRSQLRQSERELTRLTREMEHLRREVTEARQRDLERLQREMTAVLEKRTADMETRYQELLQEYQRKMRGELDAEIRLQEEKYKELELAAQKVKTDWENQSRILQQEVDKLKSHIAKKEENSGEEAKEQMKALEQEMEELDKIPCDFFRKGRKGIVSDMLAQAKGFLASGFYQAAMGLAMAAGSDARRLKLEVEEYLNEWENTFAEWKKQAENLYTLIEQEKKHAATLLEPPIELEEEKKTKHDMGRDLNFWSQGETDRILRKLAVHQNKINAMEGQGVRKSLQSGKALTLEQIREEIEDMKKIWNLWSKSSEYYQNVFRAYQDRYYILGESIIKRMEEMDLSLTSDAFLTVKSADMGEEWVQYLESYGITPLEEEEDCRELYCMTFQNSEKDLLTISIIPTRDEEKVFNQVCYYLELQGALAGKRYIGDLKKLMEIAAERAYEEQKLNLSCAFTEREKSEITTKAATKEDKVILDTIKKMKKQINLS